MNNVYEISRWLFAIVGGVLAMLEPTLPFVGVCTFAILCDCFTSWRLARRARRYHPERVSADGAKFKSHHFGKVLVTLLKSYALIVLAFLIHRHITDGWSVDLTKVAAGAICFWQLCSILENESSCHGPRWAKVARKILIDKTSRHFDIDLTTLDNYEKD